MSNIHFENIHRVVEESDVNAREGNVFWSPQKSLFLICMYTLTIIAFCCYFTWSLFVLFAIKTSAVLLMGHSVGMHRRLIHNSFECPLWLEYFLVYMGVLVGLGGPYTMIRTHDMRDWAQRKPFCHDYFAHRQHPLKDAFWQMHCDVKLALPPQIIMEPRIAENKFYHFIEKHSILVHLPWVIIFYIIGGLPWVLFGVCAQIATTVTGHWLIGYVAHSDTPTRWNVRGAGVQGRNVNFMGLLTMGECWHNNHHAFPGSALIGIEKNQTDPGWWFLKILEKIGLVHNLKTPLDLPTRPELEWMLTPNLNHVDTYNIYATH